MKTKETIYTKYDAKGRVVKRITKVEIVESERIHDDDDLGYSRNGGLHKASSKRIREAIEDYLMIDEW